MMKLVFTGLSTVWLFMTLTVSLCILELKLASHCFLTVIHVDIYLLQGSRKEQKPVCLWYQTTVAYGVFSLDHSHRGSAEPNLLLLVIYHKFPEKTGLALLRFPSPSLNQWALAKHAFGTSPVYRAFSPKKEAYTIHLFIHSINKQLSPYQNKSRFFHVCKMFKVITCPHIMKVTT